MAELITTFLMTSIVMSAMILIIMLFNKIFPKALSAKLRYIIWGIILIGLIIPFRPVIGNGLILIQTPSSVRTLPDDTQNLSTAEPVTGIEDTQNVISASSQTVSPVRLITYIWGIISIIILAIHILRYLRFTRMIHHWGVPVKDEQILSVLRSVQTQTGLSNKKIELKSCNFISSSMLTGFSHPVILLPEKHFDDELKLIFKHELIHYKRHDLFVKFLTVIATSIHWFNPVVYLMNAALQADGEAACDEAVLQDTDIENRRFYGEVIIGMISTRNTVKTPLSTCFYAGKSGIKRRLESIMDTKQKQKRLAVIGIIPVAVLTLLSGSVVAFSNHAATSKKAIQPNSNSTSQMPSPNNSSADLSKSSTEETTANTTEKAEITTAKAKEIALAKVGGGTVNYCKTEYENGRKVYNVKIEYESKMYEMDIDVLDGTITDYEEEIIQPSTTGSSNNNHYSNDYYENDHDDYYDDDYDDDHDDDYNDGYDDDHDDDYDDDDYDD